MTRITQHEAAGIIGVTINTLYRWHKQGIGPTRLKIGPKLVRYHLDEVNAWLASQTFGEIKDN
jgi:predicted DNA-binding transcriptional regulator AlpA